MSRRRRRKTARMLEMSFVSWSNTLRSRTAWKPLSRSLLPLLTLTPSAKSKKLRRKAAKSQRKLEAKLLASGDLSSLQPKIPITKQSVDLPSNEEMTLEGALRAGRKREELRNAMRAERRSKIKETNYLKAM